MCPVCMVGWFVGCLGRDVWKEHVQMRDLGAEMLFFWYRLVQNVS